MRFAPITGADDSNNRSAASEPHREHTAINFAEAVEPLFGLAVSLVFGYHALWGRKSVLGTGKGYSVLSLILYILAGIPIEASFCHGHRVALAHIKSHTAIWVVPLKYGEAEFVRKGWRNDSVGQIDRFA